MSTSIEQLKNDIDKTIQDATALLQKGILYLETKEYTYVSASKTHFSSNEVFAKKTS